MYILLVWVLANGHDHTAIFKAKTLKECKEIKLESSDPVTAIKRVCIKVESFEEKE